MGAVILAHAVGGWSQTAHPATPITAEKSSPNSILTQDHAASKLQKHIVSPTLSATPTLQAPTPYTGPNPSCSTTHSHADPSRGAEQGHDRDRAIALLERTERPWRVFPARERPRPRRSQPQTRRLRPSSPQSTPAPAGLARWPSRSHEQVVGFESSAGSATPPLLLVDGTAILHLVGAGDRRHPDRVNADSRRPAAVARRKPFMRRSCTSSRRAARSGRQLDRGALPAAKESEPAGRGRIYSGAL